MTTPADPRPLATMPPAYFAMVMATGIVAIAAYLFHVPVVPTLLFWINVVAYVALWTFTALRMKRYPDRFFADFASHERGPGFFTVVAGTAVLGVELIVQWHLHPHAMALWIVAAVLWVVFTYAVFTAITVRDPKPTLSEGINGGWLVAVVATQSLVVLGAFAAPRVGRSETVALMLVSLWLAGGMLYIWMISLIFYRYTFFRFLPSDLMPPYWINMGAMAISTLAGALLILIAGRSQLLTAVLPFLKGFTLFYWATATWWIPMLLVLGVWRHVVRRFPLRYDPLYWGLVFPLGMYATASYRLGEALSLNVLFTIARGFMVIAIIAWSVTFFGLLRNLPFLRLGRRSAVEKVELRHLV